MEWLNNNTRSGIDFFLIELHAYKISDSDPAPKFEVVEQPNDFIKSAKSVGSGNSMNKSQSERVEFWTQFNSEIIAHGKPFNTRKATTDHWYDIAIGNSSCHVSITLVNSDSFVGVELYIPDNKKACRIIHRIPGLDFDNHDNYSELMNEIIKKVVIMRDVFKKYIK